jgi:hypothetical protein
MSGTTIAPSAPSIRSSPSSWKDSRNTRMANTISIRSPTSVLFEFRYLMAGWPEVIRGRVDLMSLYSGYGNSILLERGDALAPHPFADGHVVTLEYEVHGKILKSGGA